MATTKITIVIAKYTVKANGAVIYRMRSNIANKLGAIEGCDQVERNGKFYDAYMVTSDGEYVCGCETSGEICKGSKYRGTCCHRKHVQKLLDAAKDAKAVEDVVAPAEPIEAPVEVAAEVVKAERATRWDKDLCCRVFADTGEAVEPKIFVEGLGWVTPPSDEVVDHQAEMKGWYAVDRQVQNTAKAQMRAEIRNIGQRGNLNGSAQSAQVPAWLSILPSRQVATV